MGKVRRETKGRDRKKEGKLSFPLIFLTSDKMPPPLSHPLAVPLRTLFAPFC